MTYHNAVKYILKAPFDYADTSPGARLRSLWDALEQPQRNVRYLRLAGNNGKTSCASMLVSVFKNSTYNVGCLILPIHEEVRENILIGGVPLSFDDFSAYVERIYKTVISMNKEIARTNEKSRLASEDDGTVFEPIPEVVLTKHEILLSAALLAFRAKCCQFAIIESAHTASDPTRFLPAPLVAAICGTIPQNDPKEIQRLRTYVCAGVREIVSTPQDQESYQILSELCASVNCRLTIPTRSALEIEKLSLGGSNFSYKGMRFRLNLCGRVHIANAVVTLEILEMLSRHGFSLSYEQTFLGLKQLKLPAKFEILSSSPTIVADSAHSSVAVAACCDELEYFLPMTGNKIRLLLPTIALAKQYAEHLTEKGFEVQQILMPSEDDLTTELDFPLHIFHKPADAITMVLGELKKDEILLISGNYPFAASVRYELLNHLGF